MKKTVIDLLLVFLMILPCRLSAKDMALQLYSVRDRIGSPELYAANAASTFRELHDMGYTAIEFWGYFGGSFLGQEAKTVRQDVEDAGMRIISSHVVRPLTEAEYAAHDFSEALGWWKKTIEDNKKLGIEYIVTSIGGETKTLKDLQTCCDYFNEIGRLCKEQGITYCYHSHWWEYGEVEGKVLLDYMIEHTDPEFVSYEMDVYWAVYGRVSPVEYFWKYPGRFPLLHIKDKYEIGGSGMVGFDAIFRHADVAGLKHLVVELENAPEGKTALECLRESAEYLQEASFVRDSYSRKKISVFADHVNTIAQQEGISFADAAVAVKEMGISGADVYVYQSESNLKTLDSLGFAHSSAIAFIDYFAQAASLPEQLRGTYFGKSWKEQEDFAIAFARKKGYPRVMLVPGIPGEQTTPEEITAVRKRIAEFAVRAASAGIDLTVESYDNDNSLCLGTDRLSKLLDASPSLGLTFDIGNFVFAKEDPVKALDKLSGRVRGVHLKDRAGKKDMTSVPAGTGCAKIPEVISFLVSSGYDGWYTIEIYGSKNMLEDVRTAYGNVQRLIR